MIIPKDPSLKDLQLTWESEYWYKKRATWIWASKAFEYWMKFFGPDRKPRDIFRSDVLEFKDWLRKKGWSKTAITRNIEYGLHFYRYLDERELVEKDFNPFKLQV